MKVSPPRPKGPALNALRAFEAAARHESFVLAAAELGVTAGAISQHIRTLEAWTGGALFQRNSNEVVLTDMGRDLLPFFTEAFDRVGDAIRALRAVQPVRDINIATMPSLAQLWLSGRLARFRQAAGDVRLSITALERPPNLARELFDLSVFLRPPVVGEKITVLEEDRIFPVCTRELADQLRQPEDLLSVPRLIDQSWAQDWMIWGKSAGLEFPATANVARYSLYSLALEEAKVGAGVLMGHACLVDQALRKGELVRPFEQSCATGLVLALETPENARARSDISDVLSVVFGLDAGDTG